MYGSEDLTWREIALIVLVALIFNSLIVLGAHWRILFP